MKKEVQYVHYLNRFLDESLHQFAMSGGQGKPADILNHSKTCNFHKLKYWGLVVSLGAGVWAITPFGYSFLDRQISVPERAITYQGKVTGHDGAPVFSYQTRTEIWRRNDYASHAKKVEDQQPRLF